MANRYTRRPNPRTNFRNSSSGSRVTSLTIVAVAFKRGIRSKSCWLSTNRCASRTSSLCRWKRKNCRSNSWSNDGTLGPCLKRDVTICADRLTTNVEEAVSCRYNSVPMNRFDCCKGENGWRTRQTLIFRNCDCVYRWNNWDSLPVFHSSVSRFHPSLQKRRIEMGRFGAR